MSSTAATHPPTHTTDQLSSDRSIEGTEDTEGVDGTEDTEGIEYIQDIYD